MSEATEANEARYGAFWDSFRHPDPEAQRSAAQGFFAPDQFTKRVQDWGGAGLQARLGEAWQQFLGPVGDWIKVEYSFGPEAAAQTYLQVLEGKVPPSEAHVISVNNE